MPYLGSTPNASFSTRTKQDFTANGSTTAFTLSSAVASPNDIEVFVGNVRQEPTDAYTVNGTTLTMSEAPETGLNFYVVFKGLEENSVVPADGSISTAKLSSGAALANIGSGTITNAKIASGVDASKLTTGDVPFAQLDNTFTKATIDLSSTTAFTGIPVGVNIIHLALFNCVSSGDIRIRLRTGGSTVTSNYFCALAYMYTAGSNSWGSTGGLNLTTGILVPGNWGTAKQNLNCTIVRNQTSDDSNPAFSAFGNVFYRDYNTHGGGGYMQGIQTGLGGALDGIAFNSSNTIASGKATIYYR